MSGLTMKRINRITDGTYLIRWKKSNGGGKSIGVVFTNELGKKMFAGTGDSQPLVFERFVDYIKSIEQVFGGMQPVKR